MTPIRPVSIGDVRSRAESRLEDLNLWKKWSDIGRRTGVTGKNAKRWLTGEDGGGDTFPAEFAAALHQAGLVNAVWLLVGEGVPDVIDPAVEAAAFREIVRYVDQVRAGEAVAAVEAANSASEGDRGTS